MQKLEGLFAPTTVQYSIAKVKKIFYECVGCRIRALKRAEEESLEVSLPYYTLLYRTELPSYIPEKKLNKTFFLPSENSQCNFPVDGIRGTSLLSTLFCRDETEKELRSYKPFFLFLHFSSSMQALERSHTIKKCTTLLYRKRTFFVLNSSMIGFQHEKARWLLPREPLATLINIQDA